MSSVQRAWWEKTGLAVAGGWHPLSGRLRLSIKSENLEDDYAWEYSEAHIRRLRELGITLLIGQYDRGLGATDQAADQELARCQAALCHRHGIRHGVYMPNTVYYESEMKDHPECEDWVVKTATGDKTYYGGEQTWRWVGCLNSPGWRTRQKKSIERAIRYIETDALHFDNLGQSLEPDGCHCNYCQAAFRLFLGERYPDAEAQKRRFGFTGFDTFRIPVFWDHFSLPWYLERVQNPLLQEWLEFRTATVTDYIRDLAAYARSLRPDIAIVSNGQSIHGNNQGLSQGRGDHEGQLAHVDLAWEENPDFRPENDATAVFPVETKFRGMSLMRRLGKGIITQYDSEETLAFNMTFGGHPGINTHWGYAEPGRAPLRPHQPGVSELLGHYRRWVSLYATARPAARTAVWRNQRSLLFVSSQTHLSACVAEQVLFKRRIPFSIVQDGFVTRANLRAFDLLILPDVEFVTDEQVCVLTDFVEAGGCLLITEMSGIYNQNIRKRMQPAFRHLFAENLKASDTLARENGSIDESKQHRWQELYGAAAFAMFGRGRAAYIPQLEYVHCWGDFRGGYNIHYSGVDSRYWKEPYNVTELLSSLDWLSADLYPIKAAGYPELRLDWQRLPDGQWVVPLFRCGPAGATPARIPFAVKTETPPADAFYYLPEAPDPQPLAWTRRGPWHETFLPCLQRHALVSFRCNIPFRA